MNILKVIATLLLFLLLLGQTYAEPSKLLDKAINTPASVFDFFLFKLEERLKCQQKPFAFFKLLGDFENESFKIPCLQEIIYEYDDNILIMLFVADESGNVELNDKSVNSKNKEALAKKILIKLARSLGVEERNGVKFGIIQVTEMRNGWSTSGFDELEIKKEIINRSFIVVNVYFNDGFVYQAFRTHHGDVFFEKIDPNKDPQKLLRLR